jgi:uncharacterized membrane protein (UPF0127 family)
MSRYLLLLLALGFVACDNPSKPAAAPVAELGIDARLPVRMGMVLTHLRIAATELEKARGLMGTKSLPEAEGMAFMYDGEMQMRFWMKDTPLDLDIAFVARDGTILEIKTMTAGDTDTTVSASDQVRFTVEMAAGWFGHFGVKVGDKVNLDDLRSALTARGFEAKRFLP